MVQIEIDYINNQKECDKVREFLKQKEAQLNDDENYETNDLMGKINLLLNKNSKTENKIKEEGQKNDKNWMEVRTDHLKKKEIAKNLAAADSVKF